MGENEKLLQYKEAIERCMRLQEEINVKTYGEKWKKHIDSFARKTYRSAAKLFALTTEEKDGRIVFNASAEMKEEYLVRLWKNILSYCIADNANAYNLAEIIFYTTMSDYDFFEEVDRLVFAASELAIYPEASAHYRLVERFAALMRACEADVESIFRKCESSSKSLLKFQK